MPDHVHLLIAAESEASDCLQFIARAKQYSGYYYARRYGGRLWQRYGFEHILRDTELTLNSPQRRAPGILSRCQQRMSTSGIAEGSLVGRSRAWSPQCCGVASSAGVQFQSLRAKTGSFHL